MPCRAVCHSLLLLGAATSHIHTHIHSHTHSHTHSAACECCTTNRRRRRAAQPLCRFLIQSQRVRSLRSRAASLSHFHFHVSVAHRHNAGIESISRRSFAASLRMRPEPGAGRARGIHRRHESSAVQCRQRSHEDDVARR